MNNLAQCNNCGSVWWPQHFCQQAVVRCSMCGSTTVDHTEMDCKSNRGIFLTTTGGRTKVGKSKQHVSKSESINRK